MSENKRLVPLCILYADGVRLGAAWDGAFRSVRVLDLLNRVSQCTLSFDRHDLGSQSTSDLPFLSRLSVHMGYKDDTREVFSGEVTARKISLPEFGPSRFTVTASSALHRLNRGRHQRTFENTTPPQAIAKLLDRYNLQADCDSFGASKPHWQGMEQTDLELLFWLAKRYGRDVRCHGDRVWVKRQMTHMKDEIVYEWGKSLIDFRTREDIEEQASEVRALGWDVLRASGFRGGVKIGEVGQKVGGRRDWTAVSRGGDGRWVHYIYDDGIGDIAEARELADAVMRERSFKYLRAEGSGEGNPALAAGAEVTVRQVGKAWSGEYIADAVIHDLDMESGYTTEFRLKRNMLEDEFVKLVKGRGADHHADAVIRRKIREINNFNQNRSEEKSCFFQIGQDISGGQYTDTMQADDSEQQITEHTIEEVHYRIRLRPDRYGQFYISENVVSIIEISRIIRTRQPSVPTIIHERVRNSVWLECNNPPNAHEDSITIYHRSSLNIYNDENHRSLFFDKGLRHTFVEIELRNYREILNAP